MNSDLKNEILMNRLAADGVSVTWAQADTLRRAELTLHRWAELECGDGNGRASWAIERDEETERPYYVTYPHDGPSYRRAIPDRERGALARVAAVCKAVGAHFHHQTDPRGGALYVSSRPIDGTNRGVWCGVE
jgi:hypothetical protein